VIDARWMGAAIALSERGRARTTPNPNVGCVIVKDGRVIGRGWTQPGGRPHAEAMALAEAGDAARGATVYVTLEPCAHENGRGPACSALLAAAAPERVAVALEDPDPRTAGKGIERLHAAGIAVETDVMAAEARRAMAGGLLRQAEGRPFVTLKLATSLDGCIATAGNESRWITGEAARAHGHVERSRSNLIIVGRGTYDVDAPRLDVRLEGLEDRSPRRAVLAGNPFEAEGWARLESPEALKNLPDADYALIEGGAGAAAAFLKADLVDRLLLYRAPILIGGGKPGLSDIGLNSLADAHGRWQRTDARTLGSDRLEVYERVRS
jgi:diaminohydroxyphosphoribosylaminopyrimidine deaminase/5-amino-6-(5-phosphoribosylamino)uracil reductase